MSVYNAQDTLRESIDSILAQTYTDWEFIICNDCSSDATQDILDEYRARYPEKFVLIRNDENKHLAYQHKLFRISSTNTVRVIRKSLC